ncbi:MAG: LigA [Frankiales bacterium]|nr:LigA [Frankiales bacterium]
MPLARPSVRLLLALAAGTAVLASGSALAAPTAATAHCPHAASVKVRGAQQQDAPACLTDLTTPGLVAAAKTDESDWATLTSLRTAPQPATPGLQVDGYFPDDSTHNTESGKDHDAQFVMRFPDAWNGKLLVTGAPGVRKQYATDRAISDWAVAHGYAYAATDKGNSGNDFYTDSLGPGKRPGDSVLEWHQRVTQVTVAAKDAVRQVYGRAPQRTYMTGISNGGYLTRWALEHHPELYDGGVDWEGTLFTPQHNLFTFLPVALRNYPSYQLTGSAAAHEAMIRAGFAPGSEALWPHHEAVYWDLTQRAYREEFDPSYDGATQAGTPFCPAGLGVPGCDADYDYATRPKAVKDAVARVSLTGRIGKPMLTLHGTLDTLLPIRQDSDVYDRMVDAAGKGKLHRYYVVQGGNHVDQLADEFPKVTRPVLPCYYDALEQLDAWVTRGKAPSPDGTVPWPSTGDVANTCTLPGR